MLKVINNKHKKIRIKVLKYYFKIYLSIAKVDKFILTF